MTTQPEAQLVEAAREAIRRREEAILAADDAIVALLEGSGLSGRRAAELLGVPESTMRATRHRVERRRRARGQQSAAE